MSVNTLLLQEFNYFETIFKDHNGSQSESNSMYCVKADCITLSVIT